MIKTILRIAGLLILVFLNVSLIGSAIVRLQVHERINWQLEAWTFLAVSFFDASILLPIIFEVKKISIWADRLVLNTLFWQSALKWDDIREVKKPLFLAIVVLKTNRWLYIFNRQDYPDFNELVQILKDRVGVKKGEA